MSGRVPVITYKHSHSWSVRKLHCLCFSAVTNHFLLRRNDRCYKRSTFTHTELIKQFPCITSLTDFDRSLLHENMLQAQASWRFWIRTSMTISSNSSASSVAATIPSSTYNATEFYESFSSMIEQTCLNPSFRKTVPNRLFQHLGACCLHTLSELWDKPSGCSL